MKTPRKKTVKTGRINSISVSRLYNTGNYTNVRYDLSAEVPPGTSAKATMIEMVRILAGLAPVTRPSCLDQLSSARKLKLTEQSEYQKAHYPDWLREEAEYKREKQRQLQAIEDLDRLGGRAEYRDAKLTWEDNDCPW